MNFFARIKQLSMQSKIKPSAISITSKGKALQVVEITLGFISQNSFGLKELMVQHCILIWAKQKEGSLHDPALTTGQPYLT